MEDSITNSSRGALSCWEQFYSVRFSHSVVSDSSWPHGGSTPGYPVHYQLPELVQTHVWCHPTISSSVVPFSSCLQCFPASGSFQMSQFFTTGGQSIRVSASASVLPINIQGWFPFLQDWLVGSPCCPGDSEESPPTLQFKSINSFAQLSL